ncbi:DUF6114 domain-containing protein [Umezawaea sp. Da 62-37]|uniref:DUF6114 domain-containing protein n=1 Tax=Umezawaea sp. Da 62-37 TaxID=3075927 RepID=UPI0028F7328E|nr:DUF6114 domain-containing protein [Umezawaea sp. Da 62-37]WNV90084.1 DUF6114 domain-containing protein [Umezawaea sp. Da 62-37]
MLLNGGPDDRPARRSSGLHRAWRAFRAWRRGRPFWAGLFVGLSGLVILAPPYANLRLGDLVISIKTFGGVSALLIGVLLEIAAGALWFRPGFRFPAGVVAVLLSLIALVTTNLGGFLVGTILGLLGGALAVSWTDRPRKAKTTGGHGSTATPLAALSLVGVVLLQPPTTTEPPPASEAPTSSSVPSTTVEPPSSSPPSSTTPSTSESSAPSTPPSEDQPLPPPEDNTPLVAANRAWTLNASRLELGGLDFTGVEEVPLDGEQVEVLRFTATSLKITNLVQTADLGDGHSLVTAAAPGSVSTIDSGRIELFTLRLKGNLDVLGLKIPVDYTPANPPPLNVPFATFTEVAVRNTDLRGGVLRIPGAHISVT